MAYSKSSEIEANDFSMFPFKQQLKKNDEDI